MSPVAIVGIAVGVGLVVYALSLWGGTDEVLALGHAPGAVTEPLTRARRHARRRRRARAEGFEPPAAGTAVSSAAAADEGSFAYVRVAPAAPTPWSRRLAGFLGLVVMVTVAAAVLAGVIYEAGHLINQTIARFLEK